MRSRDHFTHQLEALQTELHTLGELVVVAITRAVDALTIQDVTAARSIVSDDLVPLRAALVRLLAAHPERR